MLDLECALCSKDHDCSKKHKERARSRLLDAEGNILPTELGVARVPFKACHKQPESHVAHGKTDKQAGDFKAKRSETLYRVDVHDETA